MKEKSHKTILFVINLITAIIAIFSCAVYSKLSSSDASGFLILGITLLAYAILLFVANNVKKETFALVLRIIMNSALMGGLFIFAIVSISTFASSAHSFDIFEMFYALFGLIAFAFAVLNFIYGLLALRGKNATANLFRWCLFISLGAITLTFLGQGIFLAITNKEIMPFHGVITLMELMFTYILVDVAGKKIKEEEQPQA